MRLINNTIGGLLALGLIAALGACSEAGGSGRALFSADNPPVLVNSTGPEGDYPVVIGDPYLVDGKQFVPSDTMSYDEVGYALAGSQAETGVTAAHKTLPLPSYAEVTSLESGRTILVRVERRGPMTDEGLVALSPAALAQLGATEGAPVRVRRVNPPEADRYKLRTGQTAPERMDTPQSLVAVLKRKLPARGSADLGQPAMLVEAAVFAPVAPPAQLAANEPQIEAAIPVEGTPEALPVPNEAKGTFVIQAATFASKANSQRAAENLQGFVSQTGNYYRVKLGPFINREQADAALAKVRAAGYSDARVLVSG